MQNTRPEPVCKRRMRWDSFAQEPFLLLVSPWLWFSACDLFPAACYWELVAHYFAH